MQAVVVAYNSARALRGCVAPLAGLEWVAVTVVDNASPDDSSAAVANLPVDVVRAPSNRGFAAGCNIGVARSQAPYVLLLNPDARIAPASLCALVEVLEREPRAAIVAPRLLESDGSLAWSQFRFPRRRSTYAQALFLHRLWPLASWTDEQVRDPAAYATSGSPEWVSGACMLVRRAALEQIGPLDEGYFMYCEDIDLCARARAAGWDVRFEPRAAVQHEGGASRSRHDLLAVYARGRVRYARKHAGRAAALAEAGGVMLSHMTHALVNMHDSAARRGHLRALASAAGAAAKRR
ncbi:MAG: glycosyltransferase family 2 protein [Thermoleophilia bacterium]